MLKLTLIEGGRLVDTTEEGGRRISVGLVKLEAPGDQESVIGAKRV